MDGFHKLIKWRFVIHGCIDGFSRTIVFLECVTNNKAHTVLVHFLNSIQEFRVPLRIRSDHGMENIEVARWMLYHHGVDKNPFITGRSVHNQRIERLWVDVKNYVAIHFIDLFNYMEQEEFLDPDDEMHLFALHYVFQPRINKMLREFQSSWNNHPLRTERNKSPLQLWTSGFCHAQNSHDLLKNTELGEYGIDDEGPEPDEVTANNVQVPEIDNLLTPEEQEYVNETFDPLENDGHNGERTYNRLVQFLSRL